MLAGLAYVVMFGMMFADVGQGAAPAAASPALRSGGPRLAGFEPAWLFLVGAGLSSMLFGALYGEFFGPTGVVPVVWLAPLDQPMTLLVAAGRRSARCYWPASYGLGTVNRGARAAGGARSMPRPGWPGRRCSSASGASPAGVYCRRLRCWSLGVWPRPPASCVAYIGLLAAAGGARPGRLQAGIELFDLVIRLGRTWSSFARLAAFGLTHAALAWSSGRPRPACGTGAGSASWPPSSSSSSATWSRSRWRALVAAIQALRLEYYELFSRVFERGPAVPPLARPDPLTTLRRTSC